MNRPKIIDDPAYHCLREDNWDGFKKHAEGRAVIDFSDTDLRGIDLRAVDLSKVKLRGAYLRRRRFAWPGFAAHGLGRLLNAQCAHWRHLFPGECGCARDFEQRTVWDSRADERGAVRIGDEVTSGAAL